MKEGRKTDFNNRNNKLILNSSKILLSLTLSAVFLIKNTSAQFFGGYGYGFSLSDLLQNFVNSPDSIYIIMFLIFFTLLFVVLTRVPLLRYQRRDSWGHPFDQVNKSAAAVLSFSISALIVYYMYRSGYGFDSLLSSIGISELSGDAIIIGILVLAVLFFFIFGRQVIHNRAGRPQRRWSFWKALQWFCFIIGALIIVTALFTDLIAQKGTAIFFGAIFLVIGFVAMQKSRDWIRANWRTY